MYEEYLHVNQLSSTDAMIPVNAGSRLARSPQMDEVGIGLQ